MKECYMQCGVLKSNEDILKSNEASARIISSFDFKTPHCI